MGGNEQLPSKEALEWGLESVIERGKRRACRWVVYL